jgi:hypothetical protein
VGRPPAGGEGMVVEKIMNLLIDYLLALKDCNILPIFLWMWCGEYGSWFGPMVPTNIDQCRVFNDDEHILNFLHNFQYISDQQADGGFQVDSNLVDGLDVV